MKLVAVALLLFTFSESACAFGKDVPIQGRIFAGVSDVDPKEVNTEYEAQGIKKAKSLPQFGIEIAYPLLKALDVGLRYTKRHIQRDELNSPLLTQYESEIDQDSAALIARVPFFKSNIIRLDAFGGVGGTNTTLKMKSAAQDGQLSRKDSSEWFASPYTSYGASVAIGYKKFYAVIEAGFESNKVGKLKRTGTINDNIQTIDLSGSYVTVGFLFNGITPTKK